MMYTHISLDNLLSKDGWMALTALLTWLVKQKSGVDAAEFVSLIMWIAPNGGT